MTDLIIFVLSIGSVWVVMAIAIYISASYKAWDEAYCMAKAYVTYCNPNFKTYFYSYKHLLRLCNFPFKSRRKLKDLFEDFVLKFDKEIAKDRDFEQKFRKLIDESCRIYLLTN